MQMAVLGTVEATVDGRPVPLGGSKQRAVLALLVAAVPRSVPADALIEGVWGEDATPGSRSSLQTYVSNLRAALGDVFVFERGSGGRVWCRITGSRASNSPGRWATYDRVSMSTQVTIVSGQASLAVTVDGSDERDRPPLVFLHAGVADRRMWQAQMSAFAPSSQVVAYDRRGFGDTEGPAETFSHVDDLKAVLDDLMLEPPVLVGASQGGRIAIDFVLTHPGRAAGLFLVAPAVTGAPSPEDFSPPVEALLELLEEAEEAEDLERVNQLEAWMWLDGPGSDEGRVGGALRDLFLDMNGTALGAPEQGRESNPAKFPAAYTRLADLKLPSQVLWGDLDFPHIQQRCAHLVQVMPQALGSVIPNTAHLPNLEQPEAFNRHLQSFLDGL